MNKTVTREKLYSILKKSSTMHNSDRLWGGCINTKNELDAYITGIFLDDDRNDWIIFGFEGNEYKVLRDIPGEDNG